MSEKLRSQIEEFYLPRQLVDAILDVGGIPRESEEAEIGIGFIDIANYTFLSKFLTPKENQEVLNGLYTAFNSVLRRHGGYLNKIEGDSLMFHYGGVIDSYARKTPNRDDIRLYIARELFYTCVEMQRVSVHFNNADARFLDDSASATDRRALEHAFEIMKRLRSDDAVSNPLSAMFQIRIRVGANLGEVTIGNFGPEGARQWDVIGMPVIDAKRMESTAPIGGLRISKRYYEILDTHGIADEYYRRFKREAEVLGSRYAKMSKEELFAIRTVIVHEKSNANYDTCSIQVNPSLPEQIASQVAALLEHNRYGAEQIVDLIRYYRGNRYAIEAIEDVLKQKGVLIRKTDAYELMYPKRFSRMVEDAGNDRAVLERDLAESTRLFDLLNKLGHYQDIINRPSNDTVEQVPYSSYDDYLRLSRDKRVQLYEAMKIEMAQRAYFHNVVFPMVFASIFAAILEYQTGEEDLELLTG